MAKNPPGVDIRRRAAGVAYYFRRRVPDDLIAHYAHEAQLGHVVRRLPDSQIEAFASAGRLWAELSTEFERIRRTGSRFPVPTAKDIDHVARTGLSQSLLWDERVRMRGHEAVLEVDLDDPDRAQRAKAARAASKAKSAAVEDSARATIAEGEIDAEMALTTLS